MLEAQARAAFGDDPEDETSPGVDHTGSLRDRPKKRVSDDKQSPPVASPAKFETTYPPQKAATTSKKKKKRVSRTHSDGGSARQSLTSKFKALVSPRFLRNTNHGGNNSSGRAPGDSDERRAPPSRPSSSRRSKDRSGSGSDSQNRHASVHASGARTHRSRLAPTGRLPPLPRPDPDDAAVSPRGKRRGGSSGTASRQRENRTTNGRSRTDSTASNGDEGSGQDYSGSSSSYSFVGFVGGDDTDEYDETSHGDDSNGGSDGSRSRPTTAGRRSRPALVPSLGGAAEQSRRSDRQRAGKATAAATTTNTHEDDETDFEDPLDSTRSTFATEFAHETYANSPRTSDRPPDLLRTGLLSPGRQQTSSPQELRVPATAKTTSDKSAESVQDMLRATLDRLGLKQETCGWFTRCQDAGAQVTLEIEICAMPQLDMRCLRFERITGDIFRFRAMRNHIVDEVDL